jgi:hypothetical protein
MDFNSGEELESCRSKGTPKGLWKINDKQGDCIGIPCAAQFVCFLVFGRFQRLDIDYLCKRLVSLLDTKSIGH